MCESIGTRMKNHELIANLITQINPWECFAVRLDGRSFSTKLRSIKNSCPKNKPYSQEFHNAMKLTCHDLLFCDWHPSTVYSHSDEITVFIRALCTHEEYIKEPTKYNHVYCGRVPKILSLLAAYTSIRFSYHFQSELTKSNMLSWVSKYYSDGPDFIFDARIVKFDDEKEYMNYIIWRSKFDCYRNFVAMYCERHLNPKNINKMDTVTRKKVLLEIGCNVDDPSIDITMKYGMFLKRIDRKSITFAMPDIKCNMGYSDIIYSKIFDMNMLCKSGIYIVLC